MIKAYSYRLVPFILADDPDMKPNDAILLSRQLMNGNKWKAFVLDLSFILWNILNVFTFGILGVLWVYPYIHSTNAELYLVLRYGIADPGRSEAAWPQPIEPKPVQPEPVEPQPVEPQPEVRKPEEIEKPENTNSGNVTDQDIYGNRSDSDY